MAFHDVEFPLSLAVGATAGPARATDIATSRGGYEDRNAAQFASRRSYSVSIPPDQHYLIAPLLDFWEGRRGQLYSFPFRDFSDESSGAPNVAPAETDQTIGTGDALEVEFQLTKTYEPAGPLPWVRDITKPRTGSVVVALDGVPQASGWSVDRLTGVVTFSVAPGLGVAVQAGYMFDVPVRFVSPDLRALFHHVSSTGLYAVSEVPSVDLIEVKE